MNIHIYACFPSAALRSEKQDAEFLQAKPPTPLTPSRKVRYQLQVSVKQAICLQ